MLKFLVSLLISFALLTGSLPAASLGGNAASEKVASSTPMPDLHGAEAEKYLRREGLFDSLTEAMQAARYSFTAIVGSGGEDQRERSVAGNQEHGFHAAIDDQGLVLSPASGDEWNLSLKLKAVGRETSMLSANRLGDRIGRDKRRIEIEHSLDGSEAALVEWFFNSPEGLEQGWTLGQRPSGDGNLKIKLDAAGSLKPEAAADGRSITFRNSKGDAVIRYERPKSWDSNGKLLSTTLGVANGSVSVSVLDSDAVYPVTVDPFFVVAKKITIPGSDGFQLGLSVAVDGDTAVVGAPSKDTPAANAGGAFVFRRNSDGMGGVSGENWGLVAELVPLGLQTNDSFGRSVDISGDTIVVGAREDDIGAANNAGTAYIFSRNQGGADNWGQVVEIPNPEPAAGDEFGYHVAVSGDTVAVSAWLDDDGAANAGSVYLFERNQGGADLWGQVKKLTASDPGAADRFGWSVDIDVDTVVVGAAWDNATPSDSGSAYVYERNTGGAGNWGEVKKIIASDRSANDNFGYSVAIDRDTIVVGAPFDDQPTDSGSAYIFERNLGGSNNWGEVKKLIASDPAVGDNFGRSVAIDNQVIAIGAPTDDLTGTDNGSAYLFERNTGGADNWGQAQKITSQDQANGEQFGTSLTLSGENLIVGKPFDSEIGTSSGAAYAFRNLDFYWTQIAKPIPDPGTTGLFGDSISLDGEFAVVGAPFEDVAGITTGAAYVFRRNSAGLDSWGFIAKLLAPDRASNDQFGTSVSVSGDTIVVGAPEDSLTPPQDGVSANQAGSAHIFQRNSGGADNWGQVKKIRASAPDVGARLGRSVSISGDTAAVGAWLDNNANGVDAGAVHVYERNSGGSDNWGEVAKVLAPDGDAADRLGASVSLDGETLAAGALWEDTQGNDAGAAYIFERNSDGMGGVSPDNWGSVKKITAGDGAGNDTFGSSVSLAGGILVVGAPHTQPGGPGSTGYAYVFAQNQGAVDNWGQVKKLVPNDGVLGDRFGNSVDIDGETIVVGSPFDDDAGDNSGSAYIFRRNLGGADNWGYLQKISANDAAAGDQFGLSVSISGSYIGVGAILGDSPFAPALETGTKNETEGKRTALVANSGAAYIYRVGLLATASGATVSGRVTDGKTGLANVTVTLTDQNGAVFASRTNNFGYFTFNEIEAGQSVILSAFSKSYVFAPQLVNVEGDLKSVEIIGTSVSFRQRLW